MKNTWRGKYFQVPDCVPAELLAEAREIGTTGASLVVHTGQEPLCCTSTVTLLYLWCTSAASLLDLRTPSALCYWVWGGDDTAWYCLVHCGGGGCGMLWVPTPQQGHHHVSNKFPGTLNSRFSARNSIWMKERLGMKAIWGEITSFRNFNLETFDNNRYFPPAVFECKFVHL